LATQAEKRNEEIERLERFVTRWRAGTRARQAKSRAKKLDRTERIEVPTRERSISFGFPKTERPGRMIMEADGLRVEVPNRVLVESAGFTIERGQRVAVVGPNGAGKTTTVETLLGKREAAAGRVSIGHKVLPSYFSQHAREYVETKTIVETVKAGTSLTETEARKLLGRFLFKGELADRTIEGLSGGERRRLSLVQLVAEGGNLLVLDEPTNHLDVESREALEDALGAYDGTIILVSHDRALIDAVATHTLSLEGGDAVMRTGGYADLVALREAAAEDDAPPARAAAKPKKRDDQAARKGGNGRAAREVSKIETRIATLESQLAEVGVEVEAAGVAGDVDRVVELGERHRQLEEELAYALAEWEERAAMLADGS